LRVRIELADALVAAKSPRLAVNLMNAAPEDQKKLLATLAMRNWALLATGDFAEAHKGITEAMTQSQSAEFLLQNGLLKLSQGDVAGGRAVLEDVLKKTPDSLRTIQALTNSYFAQGKYADGIAKLKVYANQQPRSALLHAYTGQVLLIAGDRSGARAAFQAAKKANAGLQAADVGLAVLDSMEGNLDSARSILQALTEGNRPNYFAAIQLGNLEQSTRRYPPAIVAYRKAVELRPYEWLPINNLAYCLNEDGQTDEALKLAQQAKELAPKNPFVVDTLGWVYYRNKVRPAWKVR
jgi:tetratricopeptide (TPR) repeat protein